MTKQHLKRITIRVMVIYLSAIVGAFMLKGFDASGQYYGTYKDILPLIIAIPAAYLAYCFQRRNNYVQALRALWLNMIVAVQGARSYTYLPETTYEAYSQTLSKLSIVIEEARGVFMNVPAKGYKDGWYPFEPVKQIHDSIQALGFGESVTPERRKETLVGINKAWKLMRTQLLLEFDRDVPEHHHAWYANFVDDGSKSA